MKKFETYLRQQYKKSAKEIEKMYQRIHDILAYTIKAGLHKIVRQPGTFELLGCDIMIDSSFKPHLIEINMSPALACDTTTQSNIIP